MTMMMTGLTMMRLPRIVVSSSRIAAAAAATGKGGWSHTIPTKCTIASSSSRRCYAAAAASTAASSSNDAKILTWGTNTNGVLLQQDTAAKIVYEATPISIDTDVLDPKDIQSIVCGPTDTAVVTTDGRLFVAGTNANGQLGVGHKQPVPSLQQVQTPSNVKVASVQLGVLASSFVSTENDLYTFGSGGSVTQGMGLLGHGSAADQYTPKLVQSLVEDGCTVQQVGWGEASLTVLTTEGEVLTTGSSSYGRLGNGETSTDQYYLDVTEGGEALDHVSQIAVGKSFSLALQDGILFGWGRNHKGQLGIGFGMAVDMYSMEAVPVPIEADELINRTVTKVAAGPNHAACLSSTGEVLEWGRSLYLEPVRVAALLHTKIVDIACGQDYTLAVSEDGQLYAWGVGKTGVLGLGSTQAGTVHQPQLVSSLVDYKVKSVSAGWTHAACVVVDQEE